VNTLVLKRYRGKGYGKLVKAFMLKSLKNCSKNFISTINSTHNEAMQAINKKIGFKPYNRRVIYKVYLEEIKIIPN
jgi:RimJ/RimL family protein N-acetyltransferase